MVMKNSTPQMPPSAWAELYFHDEHNKIIQLMIAEDQKKYNYTMM